MGGWIGPERQSVRLSRVPQVIQNGSRLDTREPAIDIDLEHLIHVFRHIEADRRIAALPGEARAAAATEDRDAMRAADRHRLYQVLVVARNHDTDRRLSIIRRIRRVKRAAAAVKSNLTEDRLAKVAFESLGVSGVPRRPRPR